MNPRQAVLESHIRAVLIFRLPCQFTSPTILYHSRRIYKIRKSPPFEGSTFSVLFPILNPNVAFTIGKGANHGSSKKNSRSNVYGSRAVLRAGRGKSPCSHCSF